MAIGERGKLILSLSAALLGEVTANMRAVFIRLSGKEVQTRFVFFEVPSEGEIEAMSLIGTEVLADFEDETGSETYQVTPSGRIDPRPGEYLAFLRKEETTAE